MRKTLLGNEKLGYLGIETSGKLPWFGLSFDIGSYEGDEITVGFYLYAFRATVERVTLEEGETAVIMPEKSYPATYKIERMTWSYPRWFSKSRERIDISVEGGIPHEGKGENSWDCGMDATYSSSMLYTGSLRQATDDYAMSVLKQRQKYSSLNRPEYNQPVAA